MAYLEEVMTVKNDIINKLINSKPIVDTINNTSVDSPSDLIGQNIFRDLYIPDTASEAKTYICLGVFVTKITNQLIKYLDLHFWIFTHQSIMDTGLEYSRVDKLQSEIDKLMNGSYQFGIDKAELKGSYQFRPNINFGGVELIYKVPNLNQDTRFGLTKYDR
jgi:hypothetical protein